MVLSSVIDAAAFNLGGIYNGWENLSHRHSGSLLRDDDPANAGRRIRASGRKGAEINGVAKVHDCSTRNAEGRRQGISWGQGRASAVFWHHQDQQQLRYC